MVDSDPVAISGLSAVAEDYDAFILDLWGVIHDGAVPYSHAAITLQRLKEAGKRTILLSNAPRRTRDLIEGMHRMGLARVLYDDILSSGEAINIEMRSCNDPFYAALGQRCWHLGPERDRSVFEGLDVTLVASPAEATFVVNTGPWEFHETVADYEEQLLRCRERDLPMVCANPDHVVIREGRRVMCAGALAARYGALGGRVSFRGKPDPAIYDLCLKRLGGPDRKRVLAVGDALETDIAGANAAGIDAVFVTCGVHGAELEAGHNEPADSRRLADLFARYHSWCRAVLPAFIW